MIKTFTIDAKTNSEFEAGKTAYSRDGFYRTQSTEGQSAMWVRGYIWADRQYSKEQARGERSHPGFY